MQDIESVLYFIDLDNFKESGRRMLSDADRYTG